MGKMVTLFSKYDLGKELESNASKMNQEIDALEANRLLNTSVQDWCDYLEAEYTITVPELRTEDTSADQNEADVDIRGNPDYVVFDRSRPALKRGTAVTLFVPFEGEAELFHCHPSQFNTGPPQAEVREHELVFTFEGIKHDPDAIKKALTHEIGQIRMWLGWVANNVKPYNESLRQRAQAQLEARRAKLLKDQELVAALGYPLRKRDDAPKTYVAPDVRRKPKVKKPTPTEAAFVPEPVLEMEEYENILTTMQSMVTVMERSPHAFRTLGEEDLRTHVLMPLNGLYEGKATGETFSFEGKTDILIRENDRNIFIAECMIWDGPASLAKKIDQLLGYASWRDTKTAILIFNRRKDFSAALAKIPEVVKGHANYKRDLTYDSETGFRFILHHRDDPNRELTLTVLAFEVPA